MTDNAKMRLWDTVYKTDKKFTQEVAFGARKFTTIDAYYRIRLATEQWGPMGVAWGVKDEAFTHCEDGILLYTATMFYPEGQVPLHSGAAMGTKKGPDPDRYKKVATDALTKGLSKLGFCADIFMGQFEDDKYMAEQRRLEAEKAKRAERPPSWRDKDTKSYEPIHDMMRALVNATAMKRETIYAKATAGLRVTAPGKYKVMNIDIDDLKEVAARLRVLADENRVDLNKILSDADEPPFE